MRKTAYYICIVYIILFGCNKQDDPTNNPGIIKTIEAESDLAAVASFKTPDNHIIIVGRPMDKNRLGMIVKLNSYGDEIWRKNINTNIRIIWKVLHIEGSGFITAGYSEDYQHTINVCRYDYDGNLISSKEINVPEFAVTLSPANILLLTNGNFAFSFSANVPGNGYLVITDNDFNIINMRVFTAPDNNFFGCFFFGIQQIDNNTIGLTASTTFQGIDDVYTNSFLIRTDLNGNPVSNTFLIDSTQSETPNCLSMNNNGILSVTASMTGWNNGMGVYVNYLNDLNSQLISGVINLINYDASGNFVSRKKIYSYPGNGMISSVKLTGDGGFILCGTVNQNNSSTITSDTRIFLLKLDANYNEQWSKVISTVYPSYGVDAFETSEGQYVITGHQRSNNKKFNMILIKTDAHGNLN